MYKILPYLAIRVDSVYKSSKSLLKDNRHQNTDMYTVFGIFLILCVGCLNISSVTAKRCFECTDMPHPEDCEFITECSQYEECLVEQYVTSGGIIMYNSGCLAKDRCMASKKRSSFMDILEKQLPLIKRQELVSSTDIPTCVECCQGELCNYQGCGTVAQPKNTRGTKCFTCSAQANPESCRTIKTCERSQVCAILKSTHNLLEEAWETSCMREIQCNALVSLQSHANGLIGRRATTAVNHCPRCCTDDFCNHSCRHLVSYNATTIPTPTAPPHTNPPTTQARTNPPTTQARTNPPTTQARTNPPTTQARTNPPTTQAKTTHKVDATATSSTKLHRTHPPTTAKPTVKHTHPPTTAKPTVKHTHPPTTAKPTVKHTHPPTTAKPTVKHTHPPTTVKPTVKHTHPPTTIKLTTTTPPKPTTDPAVGCKVDGYIYNAHTRLCLKFFDNKLLNWTDAQDFCNSSKGQLAIITGQQKIDDILKFYKDSGYTTPLWVGATDLGNGHVFTFTDGSKLTVDPSEGHDLTEANCLYINNGSYKGYGPCKDKHGFICERSSTIRA